MNEKLPLKTVKPWGYELLFAHTDKYAGKVMFVKKAPASASSTMKRRTRPCTSSRENSAWRSSRTE